jgi:hypothetical protein
VGGVVHAVSAIAAAAASAAPRRQASRKNVMRLFSHATYFRSGAHRTHNMKFFDRSARLIGAMLVLLLTLGLHASLLLLQADDVDAGREIAREDA